MNQKKTDRLRRQLNNGQLLVAPGVYDALTARIAEQQGFKALYMTGYGVSAVKGYPDLGLLTMTEMLQQVRYISDAVQTPLIADADTGYGNPVNMYRTVREYEKAGASGIQIEDQTWPKRCGHMEGKKVIETKDMVGKIKAAADARINSSTVLIVRTDAFQTHGYEEALKRSRAYEEAGADVIFIEMPSTEERIQKIPDHFTKPCLINISIFDQETSVDDIKSMGYRVAIYPGLMMLSAISGAFKAAKHLHIDGKQGDISDIGFSLEQYNQFLGLEQYRVIEIKYVQ